MDEQLREVLWSIEMRLGELVEAVKQLKPVNNSELFPRLGPDCKVEPGVKLCDCGVMGLPHEHLGEKHVHIETVEEEDQ